MDSKNRLTKNAEWEVGARYRYLKGRPNKWTQQVSRPSEATFLGWADNGRLTGHAEFQTERGKVVSAPGVWRNRWVRINPGEAAQP